MGDGGCTIPRVLKEALFKYNYSLLVFKVDTYGTVSPHTLIRQHLDYSHWYDRNKLTLKEVHNCQYVACMNPTAGSFTINPRLQVRKHNKHHVLTLHPSSFYWKKCGGNVNKLEDFPLSLYLASFLCVCREFPWRGCSQDNLSQHSSRPYFRQQFTQFRGENL